MTLVEELVWKMLRKIRVLIVQDAVGSLEELSVLLEQKYECSLTRASSALEVGEFLRTEKYDVVFMTPTLAHGETADVIRAMRQFRPGTPVVIIGGKKDADRMVEASSAGLVGLVQTPLSADSLQQVFNAFRIPARSTDEATSSLSNPIPA